MRQDNLVRAAVAVSVVLFLGIALYALVNRPVTLPPACTNCVVGTISTGSGSGSAGVGIAYDSANGHLFVSSSDLNSWGVTDINGSTDTVVDTVSDPGRSISIAYDASNGNLYVANLFANIPDSNELLVVNGTSDSIVGTVPLPSQALYGGPAEVIYDSNTGYLDVAETNPSGLAIINPSSDQVVSFSNVSVEDNVANEGMTVNPDNGNLYVASLVSFLNFSLEELNGTTGSVLHSLVINGSLGGISYDASSGQVLAVSDRLGFPDYYNGTLTLLNSADTHIEGEVTVGQMALGVAYDTASQDIYVTNYYSSNISVIDATTSTIRGSISVASSPAAITFDSMNGCLYVVHLEGLVSIVSPPGGTCPPLPVPAVPALNGLLVLGTGAFVGTVMVAAVRASPRPRKGLDP